MFTAYPAVTPGHQLQVKVSSFAAVWYFGEILLACDPKKNRGLVSWRPRQPADTSGECAGLSELAEEDFLLQPGMRIWPQEGVEFTQQPCCGYAYLQICMHRLKSRCLVAWTAQHCSLH